MRWSVMWCASTRSRRRSPRLPSGGRLVAPSRLPIRTSQRRTERHTGPSQCGYSGTRWLRYTDDATVPVVPDDYWGEDTAARYDESSGPEFDADVIASTVDALAELAGDGAAVELAIGTGRIALPLAARGVAVSGVELSPAMAERLRVKDPGKTVQVTIGDMATTRVDGRFRLVYVVFNAIGLLMTQDQQAACFANAAAHLEAGGCFLIECGVPD